MSRDARPCVSTVFENFKIRRIYDEKSETWFFSVVDIIAVLTEQREHKKAQSYWTTLKNRLKEEGSEVVTKCDQLKMEASDGKKYLTDIPKPSTGDKLSPVENDGGRCRAVLSW